MEELLEAVAGLLIAVVVLLPGAAGDLFYLRIRGINWREPLYRTVLRWLAFSLTGLFVYVVLLRDLQLPPPIYLLPSSYESSSLVAGALPRFLVPLAGHVVTTVASAIVLSALLGGLEWIWPEAPYGAWNVFVGQHASSHWVIVGLDDGSAYTGILRYADTSVTSGDRDIILEEPARYHSETKQYLPTGHQHIFLPARAIYSIATVYDPLKDKRLSDSSAPLFPGEKTDDQPPTE